MSPSVSIVISTNGRTGAVADSLGATAQLDHDQLEVIVVVGPDDAGTHEALAPWANRITTLLCPERNLSMSRNIGIAAASGELVAFIDDDALPDPGWLEPITAAFDDPEVAAAGGPVVDHTGGRLQARFSYGTRTGLAHGVVDGPAIGHILSAPDSWAFPITLGTNSCFRRERLVEIGGFDEVFDYYHDEADVCLRLVDAGWDVRPLDRGLVFHKFAPSEIRGDERVVRSWYKIMKNLAYFAYRHGLAASSLAKVTTDLASYIESSRTTLEHAIAAGVVGPELRARFEDEVAGGIEEGRALADGPPRTRPRGWFGELQQPFRPFPTMRRRRDRLHLCLVSQEYLPDTLNGVARVVHELATSLAGCGHVVRVLTRGTGHLRVDLEDGVWVHRVPPEEDPPQNHADVPWRIWTHAVAIDAEVRRIAAIRPVDAVQFSNWDAEGMVLLDRGGFLTSVWPVTTVRALQRTDDRLDGQEVLDALASRERIAFERADRIMASSPAILDDVSRDYGVRRDPSEVDVVPLGIGPAPDATGAREDDDVIEVLFLGRLEPRKGIDVLLAAAPALLRAHPRVVLTIAGDDPPVGDGGETYRDAFRGGAGDAGLGGRVRFLGKVDDHHRDRLFARCDVFVAPSRYESFGIVLLEAMRCGRPVVASRVGGMSYIVEDGETGVLVPPGDAPALQAALERLVGSGDLRRRLGEAGKRRFDARYTADTMALAANRHFDTLVGRTTADSSMAPAPRPAAGDPAAGAWPDIASVAGCPACGASLQILTRVHTVDGRIKDGDAVCADCATLAGRVADFRWDFHVSGGALPDPPTGPALVVPELGERRLDPGIGPYVLTGEWREGAGRWKWSEGRSGDVARVRAAFTDASVRLLHHRHGGLVDIALDGDHVATVDLADNAWAATPVPIAQNLPYREHEITLRTREREGGGGSQVHVHQVVLRGPRSAGFPLPVPLRLEANEYSALLEDWIARTPPDELILECGGGDRRRNEPNHVNFEFQRYEFADVLGDIHHLPFQDSSFGLVVSQALFEHVENPFRAAEELIRVTKPGGHIVTEVAFMQPLHGAPFHFFNMTPGGVEALFRGCEKVASGWFGSLSFTVEWMLRTAGLEQRAPSGATERIVDELRMLDGLVSYEDLKGVASGVYLVVRTPE